MNREESTLMENIIFTRIRRDLSSSDIVLYMKGTAVFPLCAYSAAVVQILSQLKVPFRDINVLEDSDIREGIKSFSQWPATPQLFVKGEFVGGADIVRAMYEKGELHNLLQQKGILEHYR